MKVEVCIPRCVSPARTAESAGFCASTGAAPRRVSNACDPKDESHNVEPRTRDNPSLDDEKRVGNRIRPGPKSIDRGRDLFQAHDFGKDNSSTDFHGLIDVLDAGRRRILANTFLRAWIGWWCWIFAGLIVAAAFLAKLAGAVILAGILLGAGPRPFTRGCGGHGLRSTTRPASWMPPRAYRTACRRRSALETRRMPAG